MYCREDNALTAKGLVVNGLHVFFFIPEPISKIASNVASSSFGAPWLNNPTTIYGHSFILVGETSSDADEAKIRSSLVVKEQKDTDAVVRDSLHSGKLNKCCLSIHQANSLNNKSLKLSE